MSDLQMNPLGGGADQVNQPTNKSVRMHVMPDNVGNQEDLYQKVSKAGQVKEIKESPGKPLTPPAPQPQATPPTTFSRPQKPEKKSSTKMILIIIVVLLFLGGGSFGAWYWWSGQRGQDSNLSELEKIAEEQRLAEELRLAEEQRLAEEAAKIAEENRQKEERDRQRLSDVKDRQDALRVYFEKYQAYPENIPESGIWEFEDFILAEDLKVDPHNTTEYRYLYVRPSEKTYTLTVRLEIGFNQIRAGVNVFTESKMINLNGTIEEVPPEPEKELPILSFALDTDGDGLSDIEELLFQSDINNIDSDDDSYEDSLEIRNLYSPSNTAPQTLLDSGLVKEFISELDDYKILYPHSWKVQRIDVDDSNIIFISDETDEYVEVKIEDNSGVLPISQWVQIRMRNQELTFQGNYSEELFENKDKSLQGILLPELYMAFFTKGKKVYVITYQFDPLKPLSYRTTFLMFIKSFRFLDLDNDEVEETEDINENIDGDVDGDDELDSSIEETAVDLPDEEEFNDLLDSFFEESELEDADTDGLEISEESEESEEIEEIEEPEEVEGGEDAEMIEEFDNEEEDSYSGIL